MTGPAWFYRLGADGAVESRIFDTDPGNDWCDTPAKLVEGGESSPQATPEQITDLDTPVPAKKPRARRKAKA